MGAQEARQLGLQRALLALVPPHRGVAVDGEPVAEEDGLTALRYSAQERGRQGIAGVEGLIALRRGVGAQVVVGETLYIAVAVAPDLWQRAGLPDERLAEVVENLDQDRLEQEMALLAQRLDVDEEMDRLTTHLDEVERVLGQDEPVGRRLDFLMQELNREANTLASKSSDVEITRIGVEMKVLIEQMREQVQNIE